MNLLNRNLKITLAIVALQLILPLRTLHSLSAAPASETSVETPSDSGGAPDISLNGKKNKGNAELAPDKASDHNKATCAPRDNPFLPNLMNASQIV